MTLARPWLPLKFELLKGGDLTLFTSKPLSSKPKIVTDTWLPLRKCLLNEWTVWNYFLDVVKGWIEIEKYEILICQSGEMVVILFFSFYVMFKQLVEVKRKNIQVLGNNLAFYKVFFSEGMIIL